GSVTAPAAGSAYPAEPSVPAYGSLVAPCAAGSPYCWAAGSPVPGAYGSAFGSAYGSGGWPCVAFGSAYGSVVAPVPAAFGSDPVAPGVGQSGFAPVVPAPVDPAPLASTPYADVSACGIDASPAVAGSCACVEQAASRLACSCARMRAT